jgi:hypothetical protein
MEDTHDAGVWDLSLLSLVEGHFCVAPCQNTLTLQVNCRTHVPIELIRGCCDPMVHYNGRPIWGLGLTDGLIKTRRIDAGLVHGEISI